MVDTHKSYHRKKMRRERKLGVNLMLLGLLGLSNVEVLDLFLKKKRVSLVRKRRERLFRRMKVLLSLIPRKKRKRRRRLKS